MTIEKSKIALDIDGVLANWGQHFIERVQLEGLGQHFPKHWTVWESWKGEDEKLFGKVWDMVKNDTDFWMGIQPYDDAYVPFPVDLYITARPIPTKVTKLWLQVNGFPDAQVVTVPPETSKIDTFRQYDMDVLIDDKPETFIEFYGEHLNCILMNRPHNKHINTDLCVDYLSEVEQVMEKL